jgi:hypothetical protein
VIQSALIRTAIEKAAFINKKTVFTSKLDLSLSEKLMKCYIWSITLYGAETWKLRKMDEKYLESFLCVPEKDRVDYLDQSCEKFRSNT